MVAGWCLRRPILRTFAGGRCVADGAYGIFRCFKTKLAPFLIFERHQMLVTNWWNEPLQPTATTLDSIAFWISNTLANETDLLVDDNLLIECRQWIEDCKALNTPSETSESFIVECLRSQLRDAVGLRRVVPALH